MTFETWMEEVDRIGQREGVFDEPGAKFVCLGSRARRPYRGEDGLFRELYDAGVPAGFAIGEAMAAE